jgi:hypothetical protein
MTYPVIADDGLLPPSVVSINCTNFTDDKNDNITTLTTTYCKSKSTIQTRKTPLSVEEKIIRMSSPRFGKRLTLKLKQPSYSVYDKTAKSSSNLKIEFHKFSFQWQEA